MDVAALSLNIDSSKVVQAANDLDRFSASAAKAGAASGSNTGSIAKLVATVQSMDTKLSAIIGGLDKVAAAMGGAAASAQKMATANDNAGRSLAAADAHVIAYTQHLAGLARAQQDANAHVLAYQENLRKQPSIQGDANAHVVAYRKHIEALPPAMDRATKSAGALQANTGNIAAQFQDIGVTAAMGMNPLIIGLQQGTQLSAVFAQSGGSMGQVLVGAFRQIASAQALTVIGLVALVAAVIQMVNWVKLGQSALNGLADILVTIAPYVAGLAAVLALAFAPQIISAILTMAVAIGRTLVAAIVAATQAMIAFAILNPFTAFILGAAAVLAAIVLIGKAFGRDFVTPVKDGLNFVIGNFVGGFNAIKAIWKVLPAVIGDYVLQAANRTIEGVEKMVNGAIKRINGLTAHLPFGDKLEIKEVSYGRIANPYAGQAAAAGGLAKASMDAAHRVDYVGKAISTVNALAAAGAAKLREWARALTEGDDKKKGGKGASSDAVDRLADILRAAQAEITVEQNRLAAVGMSARATAEMEQRTKLLNQVAQAGIPVTAKLSAEVDRLAKSYADAKIAADTAVAVERVTDSLQQQSDAINDQLALVGKYGDALTKTRIQMEAVAQARDALPKGATMSDDQLAKIWQAAGVKAADQINLDRANRMDKVRKDAEDTAYALDLEAKGLGLTGAAAESYAYVSERLNAAKRDGTALTPEYVAAINAAGDAYGKARYAIDQQAKATADAREVAKGFFTDWINGVREGGNIVKTFADSVVNSLNRIIDKLLDKGLEAGLDKLFSGGGGGGGGFLSSIASLFSGGGGSIPGSAGGMDLQGFQFAKGAAFTSAQRFANGGTFTNKVYSEPTLFRFANGGKMGVMGEAGPEAVMPLTRGANGKLGVQASGGGGGGRPNITMGDVHVHNSLAGAIGPDGIAAAVQQSGERTVAQIRRELQSMLEQLDRDGTFAS